MGSCRICFEEFNTPFSLPCGHVFCSQCIVMTVQAVKPYTPIHRCPTCGSSYNVAPLDLKAVPSKLLPFVTPHVRRIFLDTTPSNCEVRSSARTTPSNSSSRAPGTGLRPPEELHTRMATGLSDDKASELARLRAENHALRSHCAMWHKRAEVHGEANLNLLKFASAMRDQASQIARDRNDLEKRCYMLKQMLDGECSYSDEMQKYHDGQSNHPRASDVGPGQNTGDDGPLDIKPPLVLRPDSKPKMSATAPASDADNPDRPRKRPRTEDQ